MRILVIEDDRELRGSLKAHLHAECFAVDTAADGEEGSFLARSRDYDLIVLDNILPKKNGLEVCKDIRLGGKHTPILMLSVKSTAEDKASLLNTGADDYLAKPFSYEELKARVHALLRRPRMLMPPLLKVDDLTLDTLEQRVRRGKKEIYLTRKEFALTEYLLRNRGTVVSRGMLMEHVWNSEIDPFSNTIEAHILNLRKKIDLGSKKKLIHTVPGRGYRIESPGKTIFT
ncbi:MAG: response regulator transcription factor [Candidatus Paceibacterota bacterium]|jgi:DNA-binding response OmpR family regulator